MSIAPAANVAVIVRKDLERLGVAGNGVIVLTDVNQEPTAPAVSCRISD